MKKFLLVLNGPMCAGKSTIANIFLARDNVFRGSSDRIKWLISNYSADNPEHRTIAKKITLAAIESAMESGLSVVVDGGFGDHRAAYKAMAAKNGHAYVSVNIEAPLNILEQRFLERVESAKQKEDKKISVDTLEGFHSRYAWYLDKNKDTEAAVLDSSKLSTTEIAAEIENMINNN
ncbi:MAG TPA: AAA family ATPase [Candidatus Paceibacterota bacterium]|nr:AAA family ATPase [Candidatus Paceibacterota bacterium]